LTSRCKVISQDADKSLADWIKELPEDLTEPQENKDVDFFKLLQIVNRNKKESKENEKPNLETNELQIA